MKTSFTKICLWGVFLLAAICVQSAQGQTAAPQNGKSVSGTVVDEKGNPVIGASVIVKGTQKGAVTDADGRYMLLGVGGSDALQFSYLGYYTVTEKVGTRTTVDAVLSEMSNMLNDVVVVGYGAQKRASITGAVASVGDSDLDRVHSATTSAMLSGKLPGLSFRQADGRPGSGATIQVRNFGADPLFVIDGVPQDKGAFDQLAPNDIESISVLKDASAAIYGLRAGNGVVLVTTKRGQENTPARINVNMYYGWQNWTRFPRGTNAYEWMLAQTEGLVNQGRTPTVTPEELEKWRVGKEKGYQSFDWYDYIVQRNAPQASINANISGGGKETKYYVSVSHLSQDAAFRDYKYRRSNVQSNFETNIGKRMRAGVNLSGRIDSKRNPAVSGADADDYWQPRNALLNLLPTERPYANDNPMYISATQVPEANWAGINYKNSGSYKYDLRVMQANMFAEYKSYYVPGLTGRVTYSYQMADNTIDNFEYAYDAYTYNSDKDTYEKKAVNATANREQTHKKVFNTMLQFMINYNRTFAEKHTVSAVLANERTTYRTTNELVKASPNNNVIPIIQLNDIKGYTASDKPQARVGYVARVNYNYDNRYYIEFSGRYDASWKFISTKRWSFFPSVSGAWRITQEPFFKNNVKSDVLSDLKIRASYGVVGDDAVGGDYDYVAGYNNNSSVSILDGDAVVGIRPRGEPVTNVSWMKNHFTNVGLDFGLFGGKLYGSFDYFYRKRTGLLATRSDLVLPSEVGYSLASENLNADAHYGFEFAINYRNRFGELGFQIGANISYARRKMVSVYNERFANSLKRYRNGQEGRYTYVNWGYNTIGVFQNQDQINNWPVNIDGKGNTTLLPGDFIVEDVNGDGRIDSQDERPIAYQDNTSVAPQPIVNGGLTLGFDWKGIDLSADFSLAGGYAFTPNWETRWPFQNGRTLVRETQFKNRWRHEDPFDPNSAWIPGDVPALRFTAREYVSWNRNLDYWTTNVVAFRFRSLEIGYTLPKKWLAAARIQKVRFYVNTYNLFSIDNVKKYGVDPEIADRNGMQYPQNRVINIGANLTF